MNKYLLSFLIITMALPTMADGHSNAEKTVIANVDAATKHINMLLN